MSRREEQMVQKNRERSQEKVGMATAAIRRLLDEDEQVTVSRLMKDTGLSRAFFYNNQAVRTEVERAQGLQEGKTFYIPQKVVLDAAMEKQIVLLKRSNQEKDVRIAELEAEVKKLKLALNKKSTEFFVDI